MRLSNFLLYESAYAELVCEDALWPDFGEETLAAAVEVYAARRRNFGGRAAKIAKITIVHNTAQQCCRAKRSQTTPV